ncbi:uncharacterized protein LOC104583582 [Brachypodium distachyon]|uniref:Uncharacterized protein n=1 Tax=Brachypodium distachyon TaxID=15368 RepID=I1I2A2_BRADI|nr:uncharacterized protein LOC104583582 [Brachypodium distachyon]KQJ95768.1 hypothetical protein BRADI_3g18900v3 [Brachypodium distachyon]|eukprot:XP_010234514.1 uncharacterized protein LOC104583582 [Brachypodium distachyon]
MGIGSRRRSAASRSVADLSTAAHEHRYPADEDDFEFEFTPLLPHGRRDHGSDTRATPSRTASHGSGTRASTLQAPRAERAPASASARRQESGKARGRRPVRWHELAFGSARVPAAMDMAEIRRRLRRRDGDIELAAAEAEAWAPWRLIRSLSCRGVEAVAASAAASASAPVRLA